MKATRVCDGLVREVGAVWSCYRLDPPLCGHEYVRASALAAAFDTGRPETLIFPSDETGEVTDFGELPGSLRGVCDPDEAIRNAGYEVVNSSERSYAERMAYDEEINGVSETV